MMRAIRALAASRGGVSALEFAIIVPVLLAVLGGVADFALAFNEQQALNQAVANGAAYAFAAQQSVGAQGTVNPKTVQSVVQASLPNAVVPLPSSQALFCVQTNSQSSPPTSTLVSGSSDTACADGNPAGSYMTIQAQYQYTPIMPFYSTLASTTLTSSLTVRLY